MVVHELWAGCTGEIPTRFCQEVRTTKNTLLANLENQRPWAKGSVQQLINTEHFPKL